jgi:hypothetical protein
MGIASRECSIMDITAAGLPVPSIGGRTGQHALADAGGGTSHALVRRRSTPVMESEVQGEVLADGRARQQQHYRQDHVYEGQVLRLTDNPAVDAYVKTENFSSSGQVAALLDIYV